MYPSNGAWKVGPLDFPEKACDLVSCTMHMTVDEIYWSLAAWSVFSDSEDLPMSGKKVSIEAIFVRLLEIRFVCFFLYKNYWVI